MMLDHVTGPRQYVSSSVDLWDVRQLIQRQRAEIEALARDLADMRTALTGATAERDEAWEAARREGEGRN